jgi:hypothetical protein
MANPLHPVMAEALAPFAPKPRAATLVFICPKCRQKAEGSVGSVNWCYCRTPAVLVRPLSAAERG